MKKLVLLILTLTGIFLLASCSTESPTATTQATGEYRLTPYHTATSTPTITPTPLDQPTQTPKPTITPTPRIYEVSANDTLLTIAYYYGITLEELQTANPDINPSLMAIGTRLVIPPAREATGTASAPTPTPFAVTLSGIECLPSATSGLHCFVLVENDRKNPATNLSGEFSLLDSNGEIVATRVVALPLKLLEPGARLPFYTYFDPALAENRTIAFNLLTATRADAANTATFPLVVEIEESQVAGGGSSAVVSGSAVLENVDAAVNRITLVAVAFDANGDVVGMRRIEQEAALTAGAPYPFTIEVFSTGGEIATVEVSAEAEN